MRLFFPIEWESSVPYSDIWIVQRGSWHSGKYSIKSNIMKSLKQTANAVSLSKRSYFLLRTEVLDGGRFLPEVGTWSALDTTINNRAIIVT